MSIYSHISGYGHYLPKKIITNNDLAKTVDTNDEWIKSRTGIEQRHIAAENEYTSDIALNAAYIALKNSNIFTDDIDLIILATATPDKTFPSSSTKIQYNLGCKNAAAFDVQAACSGFIYGIYIADAMIKAGVKKNIIVIGAETMSRVVDWKDRKTCILFGDGAGAILLSATNNKAQNSVLYSNIYSDGSFGDILATDGGISTTKTAGHLYMQGKEVFRSAVNKMCSSTVEALEKTGLNIDDIDYFIPHQANARIISACAKKLVIPEEKAIYTVKKHANTSSASIPLAISELAENGTLKKGDIIVTPTLGAGLTWGTAILRW